MKTSGSMTHKACAWAFTTAAGLSLAACGGGGPAGSMGDAIPGIGSSSDDASAAPKGDGASVESGAASDLTPAEETEEIDGGEVATTGPGDGGTLASETTDEAFSLRLLKPEELNEKTKNVFGVEWIVTVNNPTEDNPNGTTQMNGFEAFAGNLNGIDYDGVNDYSEVSSAIYVSTHEKFCGQLVDAAFASATAKAAFFTAAPETATIASNKAGVEGNLKLATIKMFGRDLSGNPGAWNEVVSLYTMLDTATAADRNNKHPLQLTLSGLCFTSAFVHTL
jgi:hypothetical protein